ENGANNDGDLFKVRPSATTPISVYGNGPSAPVTPPQKPDQLLPDLAGLTVTRFVPPDANGHGSYEFAGRAKLEFFGIESLQQRALAGYVLQTGEPRDGADTQGFNYAVRVVQTQLGTSLGGGLGGESLPANPYVVSPSYVNPSGPSSAPRIAFADFN